MIDLLNELAKSSNTPADNNNYFDRRTALMSSFNIETDRLLHADGKCFTYARGCKGCGVMLDSRMQFGLECDCAPPQSLWKSCHSCFYPLRENEECTFCVITVNSSDNHVR